MTYTIVTKPQAEAMQALQLREAVGHHGQYITYMRKCSVWEGRILPVDEWRRVPTRVKPTWATVRSLIRRGWVQVLPFGDYILTEAGRNVDARY